MKNSMSSSGVNKMFRTLALIGLVMTYSMVAGCKTSNFSIGPCQDGMESDLKRLFGICISQTT
jgi:hypothetical protein